MSNSFKARLLPLPFGQNLAVTDSSINSLRDHIEKVMPGLEALDAICPGKDFQSQSLFTCIGDLKLSAQTHHPISLKRKESPDSIGLLVPFGGQGEYRVGNRPYVPRSGQVAVFLSGATRTVKTDISSEVLFHLDKSRLMSTIDAMLGPDHTAPSSQDLLELQKDREIPLQGPAGDFQSLFRHALGIHDALHGQNQALQMLGLDETLYRGFVMLLCPNLFWRHPETKPRYRTERRRLDALCYFILAHLDEPLSLTLL